ncbi:hypothetical protein GYMLUDRAFT_239432 [Collybiopsis luxurians FD-317 M1]|nr:hypothetical protein GYMLUDRAFT_239432 [Collybiopsis luxurians FD-317 M1]
MTSNQHVLAQVLRQFITSLAQSGHVRAFKGLFIFATQDSEGDLTTQHVCHGTSARDFSCTWLTGLNPDQTYPHFIEKFIGPVRTFTTFVVPQPLQSASVVPFSNALPSAPPSAKKMQHVAFECSMRLRYPSISITDSVPTSLPTSLQPIYEDVYLANSSPEVLDRVDVKEWGNIFRSYPSTCEVNYPSSKKFCSFQSIFCLLQFHILAKLPLIAAYCIVSSQGLFAIQGKEWNALMAGLQKTPYYCNHLEELGLSSDGPRVLEGKRKAGESNESLSQLLRQESMHLGESSCEQDIPTLSCKGKEVIRDTIDVDVEMGAPEELDAMTLDCPKEVPPPPVPVLTPPAPVWKAIDNRSYCKVSSLKTWFFEPLIKQDPSDPSSATRDKMIWTAIKCIIMQVAELLSSCGKVMLEQDLWALVDGLVQGIFNDLEEQMKNPSSDPAAPFSNSRLTQFVESLLMINLSSANIVDAQQDELLRAYREYQALLQKSDHLETENLHLKEQVSSWDSQLEEKDKELNCLKSFVRHFKGDVPLTEVQQLRGAVEAQDGEIEELKEKLAASEEAHQVTSEELKL